MSTQGKRDFRPHLHFTPPQNWINDPNGMVYENGKYHLFYQHYPKDAVWGPMHWGHAVSRDLMHWEHLPIALEPDALGYIFSGSAAYDARNTSGLGVLGAAPIVAIYTSHGTCEQQSLAWSLDGEHFEKYAGNPIIPNPGIQDFRDPKIFWNAVKSCWGMVLAAGDRVHFYASHNLIDWKKTGEFGPEGNVAGGVWECPDLFPLATADGEKWVLIVSRGMSTEDGGSRTQYFVGRFDGDTFVCDMPQGKTMWVDDGFDNYAGVTFQNAAERIMIGWGVNWQYADKTPTGEFCGIMTLPRRLSLQDTPQGLRLGCAVEGLGALLGAGEAAVSGCAVPGETFGMRVQGTGAGEICLSNAVGQVLRFGVNADNALFIDRSQAGADDFSPKFASEIYQKRAVSRYGDGSWSLDAVLDVSVFEMFIDGGTRNMSAVLYPDTPYTTVQVHGDVRLTLYPIAF